MTHKCHDTSCRQDREGLFFLVCGNDKPNIIIEAFKEWHKDDQRDIRGQGRKMARYCYDNVSPTFMEAFKEEYNHLMR